MIIRFLDTPDVRSETIQNIAFQHSSLTLEPLNTASKAAFITCFFQALQQKRALALYDSNHKALDSFMNTSLQTLQELMPKQCKFVFFTSGTTGFPIGAFKSLDNLLDESQVLASLLKKHRITKVISTVPFIHLYGVLASLLVPYYLNAELLVKENFLLEEVLELAQEENTMVVTTPTFIKALSQLNNTATLESALFVSSTAPLSKEDARAFTEHYNTTLLKIFGSTETGGIAYSYNESEEWQLLEGVTTQSGCEKLTLNSPYISEYLYENGLIKTEFPFATEDLVSFSDETTFKLLGRSSKLLKVSGRRISTVHIESLLKERFDIKECIIKVQPQKNALKGESLHITLDTAQHIEKSEVKKVLQENYKNINIPFSLDYKMIGSSALGKKVIL